MLTYTIPITNTGNVTALNIRFVDTLPSEVTFVPGSFTQNGVSLGTPPSGTAIALATLAAGATSTLVYRVTVNTIPSPSGILNSATTTFTFTPNPGTTTTATLPYGVSTNIVTTTINSARLTGVTKGVVPQYADCGDILTYTITIPNTGSVTATNVILRDTIPSGTVFVNGSVMIDGVTLPTANPLPNVGVNVGDVGPGVTKVVSFKVQVTCL